MISNNKILIVDDTPSIHQDFEIALEFSVSKSKNSLLNLENNILGESKFNKNTIQFNLQHAYSTKESFSILDEAQNSGLPIAIIFMDIKMPPGMDGITASKIILDKYPNTEIVLCSGFTEFSHENILGRFGLTDHIFVLKKPFEIIEVRQLAITLMQKWNLSRELEQYTSKLEAEVKHRTQELENALVQVRKSALAKTNFLSLMSHEIRNPINSIVGLIDLIQNCHDQKTKENYIHLTQKASQTLLELVNDVLDLSKIEAHQLELENNPIDIPLLIEQLISSYSIPVLKNGRELISLYPIFLPEKIYGDSSRIKQILTNFLTNAAKFTPEGNITLELEYKRLSSKKSSFIFKIKDTGIGISEKDQKRLFTDYTQISDGIPYNLSGTGLGLSISRKIATLMDGDVGVQSKKNHGSTFWLEVKLNVSKSDCCIVDQEKITKNIGLIMITKSYATKIFFDFYAKELKVEENYFILSEINELNTLRKTLTKLYDTLHVFYDSEITLTNNNILDLEKFSNQKVLFHPMITFSYKPKRSESKDHSFTPISTPLQFKDFYKLIAPDIKLIKPESEFHSENLSPQILDKIQQCRILLVDDDPMALLITSTNLKNFGFNVDQAESSDLAIEYHKKFKFDLIFMDLMLKGTNGIEATQRIRKLPPPLNQTHIIALTANAFLEDKERCLQGGMNDFLTKPLSPNALYEAVMNFIINNPKSLENNPFELQKPKLESKDTLENIISEYLGKTYGFKDEQVQKIVLISKTSLHDTLKEIEVSLADQNLKLLGVLFHRIKGSLKNIGLNEPSDWAKTVEIDILDKQDIRQAEATLNKLRIYLEPFFAK